MSPPRVGSLRGWAVPAGADLSTPEGRRAAGKVFVQQEGAKAAAAACLASGAGAPVATFCGTVGAEVAGRLYDYSEKYVENQAETGYNWAVDQANTAWTATKNFVEGLDDGLGLPCLNPFGCGSSDKTYPVPNNFFSDKPYFSQIPSVAVILAGNPSFPASAALRAIKENPTPAQLMSTELGPPVASMMRGMMNAWNGFLATPGGVGGKTQDDLQNHFYRVEDIINGGPEDPVNAYHPYRFDGPPRSDINAGTTRNALASYTLLGMIAEHAQRLTAKKPVPLTIINDLANAQRMQGLVLNLTDDESTETSGGGFPWKTLFVMGAIGAAGFVAYRERKRLARVFR